MSKNPFRRSSLKEAATSGLANRNADQYGGAVPLTVNTKVPGGSQKHVVFASPPAIPISPISYPPSPESTRMSPILYSSQPAINLSTGYATAIYTDPFRTEASIDADEVALTQAQQNARTNNGIVGQVEGGRPAHDEDAVKATLSRFASAPRRPLEVQSKQSAVTPASGHAKKGMDVDAFKRLLLTGQIEPVTSKTEHEQVLNMNQPSRSSDTGSMAETSSTSQQSLFDNIPSVQDSTPRSSAEIDQPDTQDLPAETVSQQSAGQKKRPAPPKPRYGKLINKDDKKENQRDIPETTKNAEENVIKPGTIYDQSAASYGTEARSNSAEQLTTKSGAVKRPPPPPIARRKSQHVTGISASRTPSGQRVVSVEQPADAVATPIIPSSKAPLPPPSRRPNSTYLRRPSDSPQAISEDEIPPSDQPAGLTPEDLSPSLPSSRTSSMSKRASQGLMSPPPLPPPRRNRASSRSSIDSQRPVLPGTVTVDGVQEASETPLSSTENQSASGIVSMSDMLADLAALQKEVNAARVKGFRS